MIRKVNLKSADAGFCSARIANLRRKVGERGDVIAHEGTREKLFIATKLEAPDAAELKRSLSRLKTAKLDLLQLHNVRNSRQSLAQFKEWKAQGICRYVGVTSTFHGDFAAMESVIAREQPDFVQIDYSLDDREAQKRILPLAAEVKAGVLTALPFGRGRLFRAVRGKAIPDWAQGFAATWSGIVNASATFVSGFVYAATGSLAYLVMAAMALIGHLDRLRSIVDALDDAVAEAAAALIAEANRVVQQEVVAHERDDEGNVYPQFAKVLRESHGLSAMSRAHREILHLARLLARVAEDMPSEKIDRYLIRDAQRLIEAVETLVRLHTAQEEDIYEAVGERTAA